MLRLIAIAAGLAAAGSGGVWYAVTADAWPLDDRSFPATLVWSVNGALGRWLVEHGDASASSRPPPPAEQRGLTADERAKVEAIVATLPTFRDTPAKGWDHGTTGGAWGAPRRRG